MKLCESSHVNAVIAQTVERNIGNVEVTGSIPVSSLRPDRIVGALTFMNIVFTMNSNLQGENMNKLRKALYLICFMIIFAVFQGIASYDVHAEDVNVVIALTPDGEIGVGDKVTATVIISGESVSNYTIYLKYSSGLLEYQSDAGNTGSIAINGTGATTVSYTFKAIGEGRASVSTDGTEAYDAEGNVLSIAHAGANITVGTVEETDNTIKVGSETYTLVNEYHLPTPPKDYQMSYVTLGDREWLCYKAPNQNLKVVCLRNVDGEQKWFVFDEEKQSFSPFLEYKLDGINYVVINKPDEVKLPEGFEETSLTLDKTQFTAYTDGSDSGMFLVYAINPRGDSGLYYFDSEEGTLTRYEVIKNMIDTATAANAKKIQDTASDGDSKQDKKDNKVVAPLISDDPGSSTDEEDGLLSRETLKKLLSMMIILFIVMCIALIIMVIRSSILQNRLDNYEDDDESDDEDDYYDEDDKEERARRRAEKKARREAEKAEKAARAAGGSEGDADKDIVEKAKHDAAQEKVVGKNKSYNVNEDTGEIMLEEARDNNAGVNVPLAEDQVTDKVEEAMKQKPFGIDSAFDVAAADEVPEGDHVYVEQGTKKEVVDNEMIEKVRGEKNDELAVSEDVTEEIGSLEDQVTEKIGAVEEELQKAESEKVEAESEKVEAEADKVEAEVEKADETDAEEAVQEEAAEAKEDTEAEEPEQEEPAKKKSFSLKGLWQKITDELAWDEPDENDSEDEPFIDISRDNTADQKTDQLKTDDQQTDQLKADDQPTDQLKSNKSAGKSNKSAGKSGKKKVVLPKTDEDAE